MINMKFGYNPKYMTKNNEPWFPIMGEIHYSRYARQYWNEAIYKMKAGGVSVVSCYTIWIHHEEIEGDYDFSGDKDLRKFAETCKECGIYLILRVGPWIHGEVRNGGLPDWLLNKEYEVRSNDQRYFDAVRKYYKKLYEQVEGLLIQDGGPIIGLQIENEYGHCGGLNGPAGESHMVSLHEIAKEVGFVVPLYTATGWGGAVTGGLLPVMGGYCEAPWAQSLTEIAPSGNYIFTHERNDHNIGSDYGFGTGITFDITKFPYLTAELGGGMQVTHHRRPVAHGSDIGAMSLVKLGSGVNLLGYYMYHGGTNPKGKLTTLQETRATGYPNDLPELSYDFRAPLREYGQISSTFKEIKLLTSFIHDFGSELCEMPAYIPESNPLKPTDNTNLRTSYRHNGESGYVFVNNYQRRREMASHKDVVLSTKLEKETITFPLIDIEDKEYFFYPFNMKLGNMVLKTALATPLCRLDNEEHAYIFYTTREPNYVLEGEDSKVKIITLTREDALNAYKVKLDKEYLVISNHAVIQTDRGVELMGEGKAVMKIYPELKEAPAGYTQVDNQGEFAVYTSNYEVKEVKTSLTLLERDKKKTVYEVNIDYGVDTMKDCFLHINYGGDSAKVYLLDELIADSFYTGETWDIGLRKFNFPRKLTIEIYPLHKDDKVFLEKWPLMDNGVASEITDIKAAIEYHTIL